MPARQASLAIAHAGFLGLLLGGVLAPFAPGCAPDAPSRASADAPFFADATPAPSDISAGRSLFAANCARCHQLYDPGAYSRDEWRAILPRMARKARLSSADTQEVWSYLCSASRDSR